MSGFFNSLEKIMNPTRSRKGSNPLESSCYTLYVHHNETTDIDEELPEPPMYQIPVHMKWRDVLALVQAETGCDPQTTFLYYDDEDDEVCIDSQEEYETALHICRKDRRDLHIYNNVVKRKRLRSKKKTSTATKVKEEFTLLPGEDQPVKDERPPPSFEEAIQENSSPTEVDAKSQMHMGLEGAVGGAPAHDEGCTSSTSSENPEETKPMSHSQCLISLIRKHARDAVQDELDDLWAFVNAFKRDINSELHDLGNQVTSNSEQLPKAQKEIQEHLKNNPGAMDQRGSDAEATNFDINDINDFVATFVCESLPDGSVVEAGKLFEKHWVFRNDGKGTWDENTKLHLLESNCSTQPTQESVWGPVTTNITVPPLKEGESGVVCAKHIAPENSCEYQTSWTLSHVEKPFGPRVWCNVQVEGKTPVEQGLRSFESFEELSSGKSLPGQPKKESRSSSMVATIKDEDEEDIAKQDSDHEEHHSGFKIMSFTMDDISNGAKHIEPPTHEEPQMNPAVSTVTPEKEEEAFVDHQSIGASVDIEDRSTPSTDSPVLVTPPDEGTLDEEPKTLENEDEKQDVSQAQEVENFTEPPIHQESGSDEEEDTEDEEKVVPVTPEEPEHRRSSSEDLHSVDFNVEDEPPSMMSYASDFVVVPLPDCFDVNKPLAGADENEEEDHPSNVTEIEDERVPIAEGNDAIQIPEEKSDSEPESLPPSVTEADGYKSDPSTMAQSEKTPSEPSLSLTTPKVINEEAAAAVLPSGGVTPQPESVDGESLTERITKEFDEFLANPTHPVEPPPSTRPKVPMNQMPTSKQKIPMYIGEPHPVPSSVVNQDTAYEVPNARTTPSFPPFEQGWCRNPIPIPSSVNNEEPWPVDGPATRLPLAAPRSEFSLNQPQTEVGSALPAQPFAIASPTESMTMGTPEQPIRRRGSSTHDVQMMDPFNPGFRPPGSNVDLAQEDVEDFRTPPRSPVLRRRQFDLGPLDQLYEMGFHDLELNQEMFEKCGRDLNRTVQALILRAEAERYDANNDVA